MKRVRRKLAVILALGLGLTAAATPATGWALDVVAFGARGINGNNGVYGGGVVVRTPANAAPAVAWRAADELHWRVLMVELDAREPNEKGLSLVSVGIEWQWNTAPFGLDTTIWAGTGPTVLSNDQLGENRLGGRFHFTSHLAVGIDPTGTRRWQPSIGIYHVSNAGLQERNPGFEMQTLELRMSVRF